MFDLENLISNLKNWGYEAMKAGINSLPVAGATGISTKHDRLDRINASKSQRVMRRERGSQPQQVKARRFDRYKTRMLKRKNSFCNNVPMSERAA